MCLTIDIKFSIVLKAKSEPQNAYKLYAGKLYADKLYADKKGVVAVHFFKHFFAWY